MSYLSRKMVNERLKLAGRQSYRIVAPSYGQLIRSDDVLRLLNNSRRGIREPFMFIPSDLLTPDELAADPELAGAISAKKLKRWTHRIKNVPPHFHINNHVIRFPRAVFFRWLDERTRKRA